MLQQREQDQLCYVAQPTRYPSGQHIPEGGTFWSLSDYYYVRLQSILEYAQLNQVQPDVTSKHCSIQPGNLLSFFIGKNEE